MIVEVTNTYHDTKEFVIGDNLEEIKKLCYEDLEYTAQNLAGNEVVEEDWEDYYDTYEEAEEATVDLIYEQLVSELEFKIIE